MSARRSVSVAVCVATKDRVALLQSCIYSILRQDLPAGVIVSRICVADNSSSASARTVVASIAESKTTTSFEYRHVADPGYASARNALLEMVAPDDDFFAFIDDDEVADIRWLGSMVGCATTQRLDVVAGPIETVTSSRIPAWIVERGHLKPRSTPRPNTFVPAGNLLVSTRAWMSTGLRFDPRFDGIGGEDSDWTLSLLEEGCSVGYCEQARLQEFWTAERLRKTYWRRRAFRSGRSDWLRHAKRAPASGRLAPVIRAAVWEGVPRVISGGLLFAQATMARKPDSKWRAEARILRGLGAIYQAVCDFGA